MRGSNLGYAHLKVYVETLGPLRGQYAHLILGRCGMPLLQAVEVDIPRVTFTLAGSDLRYTEDSTQTSWVRFPTVR